MVTEDVSLVLVPARVVLVVVEWTGVVVSPPRATQPLLSVVIFTPLFLRKKTNKHVQIQMSVPNHVGSFGNNGIWHVYELK